MQVTSYGGKLVYTIRFQIPRGRDSEGVVKADVRIEVDCYHGFHIICYKTRFANIFTVPLIFIVFSPSLLQFFAQDN